MIDFKKLSNDRNMKRGYCILPELVFLEGECSGVLVRNTKLRLPDDQLAQYEEFKALKWTVEIGCSEDGREDKSKRIISFKGGPTGWESYQIETFIGGRFWEESDFNKFYLCAGTYNRWDSLYITKKEALKIKETLLKYIN